jgi:hypothetical protein
MQRELQDGVCDGVRGGCPFIAWWSRFLACFQLPSRLGYLSWHACERRSLAEPGGGWPATLRSIGQGVRPSVTDFDKDASDSLLWSVVVTVDCMLAVKLGRWALQSNVKSFGALRSNRPQTHGVDQCRVCLLSPGSMTWHLGQIGGRPAMKCRSAIYWAQMCSTFLCSLLQAQIIQN